MVTKRALVSVWMCGSVLTSANIAQAQENDYRYGQLLVQRSQSTWNRAEPAAAPVSPAPTPAYAPAPAPAAMTPPPPAAPTPALAPAPAYAPAPQVIPSYAAAPAPTTPPPAPAKPTLKTDETARKPVNAPASPMLGAYYMPAPPVSAEEPELAPGETLPSPAPTNAASYTAAATPSLESQPLVPEHIASENTRTFMYRLPSGALASSDGAYIGGVPGPEHPGGMRETDVGPSFQGPVAADPGYLPGWLKLHAGNGYRRNRVEVERTSFSSTGQKSTLKEDWKSVGMYQVKAGADFTNRSGILNGLYLEGDASYGTSFSGDRETTLTTFATTPDTDPVIEQGKGDADEGDSYAWSAAIGYELSPDFIIRKKAHTSVVPLLGYRFESLDMTSSSVLAGSGLRIVDHSSEWDGPFIGLKIGLDWPNKYFAFRTTYAYGTYSGETNTNNPVTPTLNARVTEESDASGLTFGANFGVDVYEGLEVFIAADLEFWSAGSDTANILDTTTGTVTPTNLDDVSWKSQFYQVGLSYRW